ncbi:hypothetical protein SMC26_26550 [Actinomadura fulvescens]|uniref:Secreted protein n=1 Tax=Actinomadura fulvescens TaxID=46160 RepID=A0ABP6CKL4_9ACTN
MNEQRTNLVKRVAATAGVAGALAIGGVMTAGAASAETVSKPSSTVLTNVTPGVVDASIMANRTCCQNQQVQNNTCC